MDLQQIDSPSEATTVDAPASSGVGSATSESVSEQPTVLNDPSLIALSQLSKSVRRTDAPIQKAINERLGKLEPQIKEVYNKVGNLKNGQKNGAPPKVATEVKTEVKTESAPAAEATKESTEPVKPSVSKPSKLFTKPTVEAAKTGGGEAPKYFLSEEHDKILHSMLKPVAGDNVNVKTFMEETLPQWRKTVSKAAEYENNYKAISEQVNSAPEPLRNALVAVAKGDLAAARQYAAGMSNYIDYSKPFADQAKVAMKVLMPKINIEDASADNYVDIDDDSDPKIKNLKSVAEDLFNKEKVAETSRIEREAKEGKERQAKAVARLQESIKKLNDNLPDDLEKKGAYMKSVESVWRSQDGVERIFFEEDGTPVADAAERAFNALHAPEVYAFYQQALYDLQTELQNLIASGVGKSAAVASSQRNYVSAGKNDLVSQTRRSIPTPKNRLEPVK